MSPERKQRMPKVVKPLSDEELDQLIVGFYEEIGAIRDGQPPETLPDNKIKRCGLNVLSITSAGFSSCVSEFVEGLTDCPYPEGDCLFENERRAEDGTTIITDKFGVEHHFPPPTIESPRLGKMETDRGCLRDQKEEQNKGGPKR